MGSLDDLFKPSKEKKPSKIAVFNYEKEEQIAYEKAKKQLVKKRAKKEGHARAKEDLFGEEKQIAERKRIKELRIERLKQPVKGLGRYAERRFSSILNIKTPKVSKSAKKGLFNRSSFGR